MRLVQQPSWTAERLASEMAAVGVPWTRDTVVNLETGRRKRVAAHELLALAYVLNLETPVDLLAPVPPSGEDRQIAVVPDKFVTAQQLRNWCMRLDRKPGVAYDYPRTFQLREKYQVLVDQAVKDGLLSVDASLAEIHRFLEDHERFWVESDGQN